MWGALQSLCWGSFRSCTVWGATLASVAATPIHPPVARHLWRGSLTRDTSGSSRATGATGPLSQQTRVYPYPFDAGSARPNPKMGAPDPESPLFLGFSVPRGGLRPCSQTMVSEGARPWGRGRSGDCDLGECSAIPLLYIEVFSATSCSATGDPRTNAQLSTAPRRGSGMATALWRVSPSPPHSSESETTLGGPRKRAVRKATSLQIKES